MKTFYLPSTLFIVLIFGLFGTEAGAQWVRLSGPYGWEFNNFAAGNSTVLAGSISQGVYRSTDNGMHWTEANNGLWCPDITALGVYKQNFLAGAYDGKNNLLFLSSDNANTWAQVNTISPIEQITCFAIKDTVIFAGTYGDGVYRSTDGGYHWVKPNNGGLLHQVVSLAVIDSNIYAGTWGGAVYKSKTQGDTWYQLSIPNYNAYVSSLFILNNKLFMASGSNLFSTIDDGLNWNFISGSLPTSSYWNTVTVVGSKLYYGTNQGLYLSTDDGSNWSNIGLTNAMIEAVTVYGGNLITGTRNVGIFTSQDNGMNWLQTGALNNMMVQALASIDSNLFVGDNGQEGVFISRDNGNSYKEYNNLNHSYVYCMKTKGTDIYAGTGMAGDGGGGIFKSTDLGKNWNRIGLQGYYVSSINYNQSYLFVSSEKGIMRSSNEGATWNQVINGLPSSGASILTVMDTILFASPGTGIFKSTNNGTDWISYGLKDTVITSLLTVGDSLFAGTPYGIFRNISQDTNWVRVGFADKSIAFLELKNRMIFTETIDGLYFSNNNGISWLPISTGFDNISITSFTGNDKYLFAGSWGEGVWKRPLSEIITGITVNKNLLPSNFSLQQNYPNPFNPSTTIEYSLTSQSNIKLILYNMLGQVIQVLKTATESAGYHKVSFTANNLASGIYFYKIIAKSTDGKNEFSSVKKLMLLK